MCFIIHFRRKGDLGRRFCSLGNTPPLKRYCRKPKYPFLRKDGAAEISNRSQTKRSCVPPMLEQKLVRKYEVVQSRAALLFPKTNLCASGKGDETWISNAVQGKVVLGVQPYYQTSGIIPWRVVLNESPQVSGFTSSAGPKPPCHNL